MGIINFIKKYEKIFVVFYLVLLFLESTYHSGGIIYIFALAVYLGLISYYFTNTKNTFSSILILVSILPFLFLILVAAGFYKYKLLFVIGYLNLVVMAFQIIRTDKKNKLLAILLLLFIVIQSIIPFVMIPNFEITWVNYPIVGISMHILLSSDQESNNSSFHLLKLIILFYSLGPILDLSRLILG